MNMAFLEKNHPLYESYINFLKAFCEQIPFSNTLASALEDVNQLKILSPAEFTILFPKGLDDIHQALYSYFIDYLQSHLSTLPAQGIKAKLHHLLMLHFTQHPYMGKILQKIGQYQASKAQFILLYDYALQMSDSLWGFIQDFSTDYNYYSKRILLANIYIETILYASQDSSKDLQETSLFIKRQFDKIGIFETVKRFFKNPFSILKTS